MDDNTINLEEITKQVDADTSRHFEQAFDKQHSVMDIIMGMKYSIAAYKATIARCDGRKPNEEEQRAIKLTMSGILMYIEAYNCFGISREQTFRLADAIYSDSI